MWSRFPVRTCGLACITVGAKTISEMGYVSSLMRRRSRATSSPHVRTGRDRPEARDWADVRGRRPRSRRRMIRNARTSRSREGGDCRTTGATRRAARSPPSVSGMRSAVRPMARPAGSVGRRPSVRRSSPSGDRIASGDATRPGLVPPGTERSRTAYPVPDRAGRATLAPQPSDPPPCNREAHRHHSGGAAGTRPSDQEPRPGGASGAYYVLASTAPVPAKRSSG